VSVAARCPILTAIASPLIRTFTKNSTATKGMSPAIVPKNGAGATMEKKLKNRNRGGDSSRVANRCSTQYEAVPPTASDPISMNNIVNVS
jgi:hypothetical protein